MKILYISQYFPPEMGAPAARAAELSHHWANAGHEVTILTGFPNHPTGVVPAEYRAGFRRLVQREKIGRVDVVRTWLLPFPNRKTYERILNYTSFCISAAVTGSFLSRHDVVIGSSPQLLVALAAWWVAKWKRVPFVFEVRDLWPESLVGVGMGSPNSLLHKILGKIAGFLYRCADRIVVVTAAFEDYLADQWGVPREKMSVVENGVETELFAPQDGAALEKHLNLEGKFAVAYIGTIGMAHGLETVVATAELMQTTDPEVVFMVVGEGAEKVRVTGLARDRGLVNMHFFDQQPREKIPAYIAASDVCIVPLKRSEIFKTVIPTKMLEFMSCGRAVILGVEGHAQAILEEAQAGVAIEPENAQALADAIRRMRENPNLAGEMGRRGREYIVRKFSRHRTAEKYSRELERVISPKQSVPDIAA